MSDMLTRMVLRSTLTPHKVDFCFCSMNFFIGPKFSVLPYLKHVLKSLISSSDAVKVENQVEPH